MERRDFIKHTCKLCVAAGGGLMLTSLASCSSLYMTSINGNKITVPVSLFDKNELQVVRAEHFDYDIAVRKEKDGTYAALLMRCTHAENQLISTGKEFTCSLHGSKFNREGVVTKGPAVGSLKKYFTEVISGNVIITLN